MAPPIASATAAEQMWTSRTYVWTAPDSPIVSAFYAITPTSVDAETDGLSAQLAKGLEVGPRLPLGEIRPGQNAP
ncbi:hypothetical protein GCM10023318_10620 [Nocardia callitridis]|uniref:Uncharacterized protein n=1 Tax=Nocardia callitridis TaxID=648753 RepID=A0ABP9JY84_9NOCA